MYQRKPVIMFIPDANDNNIKNYYDNDYISMINSLKNGTIYFENKFFKVEEVVDKIIYYIRNDFKLEENIKTFYDSFELNSGQNHIQTFINYVENLS